MRGAPIFLTAKEFQLLLYFASNDLQRPVPGSAATGGAGTPLVGHAMCRRLTRHGPMRGASRSDIPPMQRFHPHAIEHGDAHNTNLFLPPSRSYVA
ncbi:helix-turn-helix domain-containing protein [Cupriavidus sp. L7L]|uniref:helix-turn-helix domain-containing protein n=1 Tax=Cupriavidus sp. L7L TaxID=2546443 RepID=UPI001A9E8B34|nr:helix-turn-helix domain-containing protein [Cupriavidus sp. L7L]